MIRFTNTIDIARPVADVFAYLADLEHTPEWNWAITSTRKLSSGPVGTGTRYRQIRSVPRTATQMLEVARMDPGRRIDIVGELASFPARLTYEVTPIATGTRVTNSVELDPKGLAGLLGGLAAGRIQASVAENLGVLRTLLEQGKRSTVP